MATLITNADGNFTGASTFAASETGTSALAMIRANSTTLAAASSVTSPTFTVTNTKVIDGVILWVKVTAASPTGTFKVDLQKGGVSQATVTVNKADLPQSTAPIPYPVFFKFTSTATGDGGSNWTIVLTTTGTQSITYYRNSATTGDATRALRTTTAATAAAGDNLFIVGELTGAGTHTSRAVTMNSTATTVYGNGSVNSTSVYGGLIAVTKWATLSCGTSAATNYALYMAGDFYNCEGTVNFGTSGSEIPRDSTVAVKFQPVSADNDFGLSNYDGAVTIKGLSRTSGKNIVKAKLNANVTSANIITSNAITGGTVAGSALGPEGSPLSNAFSGSTGNSVHGYGFGVSSGLGLAANTVIAGQIVLNRGSGTYNRYMRVELGNAITPASVTSGVYVDVDLQAGTIGTPTAFGTGASPAASIAAYGTGYVIKISGSVSSGVANTAGIVVLACSAAGTTSYVGDATQAFIYSHPAVIVASSIPATTTWTIDADTGWKSGDRVAIASTSQTAAECEQFYLSADAGASSFTTVIYPTYSHSGTSPTQAEVILLTRNVTISSTSSTSMAYIYSTALGSFDASWMETFYLGGSADTDNKRGIEFDGGATAGAKTLSYCAMHDGESRAVYVDAGSTSANLNVSYCTGWNSGSFALIGAVASNDYTFDNNVNMLAGGFSTGNGFQFTDGLTGTITNNTSVGSGTGTSSGFAISLATIGAYNIGTFQNNTTHSGAGPGSLFQVNGFKGVIDGLTIWRHNGYGIQVGAGFNLSNLKFTNLTIFGTSSSCIYAAVDVLRIETGILCGDTTFPTTYAIFSQYGYLQRFDFTNVDMNPGTGIYASIATAAFYVLSISQPNLVEGVMNNCRFPTTLFAGNVTGKDCWAEESSFAFQKFNQTAGDHRTELNYGGLKTDTSIYNTASPSMRMTPSSASNKLPSASRWEGVLFNINSGQALTVAASIRKSAVGDGAAYNGNQPRLIARANAAIGITSDTVLATYSAGTGSWNTISGTTPTATDDGAVEIIVDCDGTAGWINVDDIAPA